MKAWITRTSQSHSEGAVREFESLAEFLRWADDQSVISREIIVRSTTSAVYPSANTQIDVDFELEIRDAG